MNSRPGFWHGVAVAACLGLAASVLVTGLAPLLGMQGIIKLTASLLGLAYISYLLRATRARTGRILTLSLWGLVTIVCWWFSIPLPFYLLIQVGAMWLIRSFHAYSGLVPAVFDALLSAFSVLAFSWAFVRTGSVFLATWCFFLVQALWAFIPRTIASQPPGKRPDHRNEPFERARRRADAALRQLFSQPG